MRSSAVSSKPLAVPAEESARLQGRVLVVDDELPNRLYLRKLLTARGCTVSDAHDGPAALQKIHRQPPDLVLADVIMPGMDGFALCAEIKRDPACRHVPVIMVTAKSGIEDLARGFDLGAMDYIRKPFDARELVLRVGNALELKRSNDLLSQWNRRVARELELAGAIQRSMFSEEPLFAETFDVRIKYSASMDVGGDAFDVIQLPAGRCGVYVADVSGHGVAPAMISSMLKATAADLIRTFHMEGPARICNELHSRIGTIVNNPAYYATLLLALYDPVAKQWVCMNCGHPDPLLMMGEHPVPFPSGGGGIPIGMPMGPDHPYAEEDQVVVPAEPGLRMLLYTDGLTEAVDEQTGEECGAERLQALFSSVVADPFDYDESAALLRELKEAGYSVGHDDCTVITIRTLDPARFVCAESLAVDPVAICDFCEKLEQKLVPVAGDDLAARMRLVAIEHAMNVAEHGGLAQADRMGVRVLEEDRTIRMVMTDPGREWDVAAAEQAARLNDAYAEGGRGLIITRSAADAVEYYRRDSCNVSVYHFKGVVADE